MQRISKLLRVGALALIGLLSATTAQAQTTAGAITGVVTDESTGVPMLLVTVVATSPALQGTQSEFTDASGNYYLSNLPPGNYSLLFIYGDAKVRRENIDVGLGKVVKVNAKINTQATGEVITIKERAPTIDAGSTKQGTTLEQDYLKNVPQRGRTYEATLGAAAGSQGDTYGVSFGGSQSVENNYVVDGINTTGLSFGTVGSPLLNNFIQEIEVITGGYNAEFGRATGGVINVITKTGSNEFHGSVWGQFVPFEADRKNTPTSGDSLLQETNLDAEFDFGFELGGPIVKDKLWFYVGFAPQVNQRAVDRIVQTQVDRRQNLFNYANAGCIRNTVDNTCDGDGDPATTSAPGCELSLNCEGDGDPDLDENGFTAFEEVDRTTFSPTQTSYQFLGKLNFAVTPDHQGQVALNGTYSTADTVSTGIGVFGTPTAFLLDRAQLITDLSAKWTSKFNNNKTQVDIVAGWHRYKDDIRPFIDRVPGSPSLSTVDTPQTRITLGGLSLADVGRNPDTFESDRVLQFCDDDPSVDQFPDIQNCPVAFYAFNSPVSSNDQTEQRYSAKLTLTQRVKLAGHHQFKLGGDYENNKLDDSRNYNGGRLIEGRPGATWFWREWYFIDSASTGDMCLNGFSPGFTTGATAEPFPCEYLDTLLVSADTNNWSAFIQDSWSILPNLTVNAGLRYEEQRIGWSEKQQDIVDLVTGEPLGPVGLKLTGMFAPRLGVIYDWTKEGRSKVYANYGRFYESVPMDINLRTFGGETQFRATWVGSGALNQCGAPPMGDNAPAFPSSFENCPSGTALPRSGAILGGSDPSLGLAEGQNTLVMPGTKAQYIDEFAAGVEYELLEDLRVGLSYQNRRLGRVIEDMSTDGGHTYFIGNPGEFDEGSESELEQQVMDAEDGSEVEAILAQRLALFRAVREFDKPTRDYHAVQLTAVKRFSRAFMMQASYTYSRLRGNIGGLFSAETGQLDPNINSQYDLVELFGNRFGDLAADRPHLFKVDGYYTFDFGSTGRLTTGVRVRGQSGKPINTLGAHNPYGDRESFILPRGSGGRTPFTFGADLQLSYARKFGKMDLEVYIQLLDVLNLQQATSVDEEYTAQSAAPIIGGGQEDLPYLKDSDDPTVTAQKKLNFGNPSARTLPLFTRVGATLSF